MSTPYESLMQLQGADELKALVNKWETLSDNINSRPLHAPILLPDILMYTRPGFGNTTLLRLLASYLSSKQNLMDFYGDVPFIEFMLTYTRPDEPFAELNRLIEEVRTAAGFRSGFRGIVRVNIDEWIGHHEEKHFLRFLDYLAANSEEWLIILSVSRAPNANTKAMAALLSMYLRLETVSLSLPETDALLEHVSAYLLSYGLTLDEGGRALLRESVEKLRGNKYFDGLHTIQLLSTDIVYYYYSLPDCTDTVLTAEELSAFSASSEYIQRTIVKFDRQNSLGFSN